MESLNLELTENEIKEQSKSTFKTKVKDKINNLMFSVLKQEQKEHSKIQNICYSTFKRQSYLKTHLLNNHEVSLLFSLRSKTAKQFKANFPYFRDQKCPMGCSEADTQEHALICDTLHPVNSRDTKIAYEDIFSADITRQAAVTKLFSTLLERREDAS